MKTFTNDGLTFEVSDRGPEDGPVVILLHGFPQTAECWAGVAPRLADAGLRVLAPNQRGYSPQARPTGRRAYLLNLLMGDVLALADSAGAERFHLVGHDWGAVVAWSVAAEHPERVASLTTLSVPHPRAF
ncbi:MAG: alpha/beta fold hydrolase, partial [Acidimicrobiales bacterium]